MEDVETLLEKAQDFETRELFWEAGEEYKNALLEFNKSSGFKDEKGLCKRKIREMNVKKASDFKEVVAKHQFTEEQTKQLRELVYWFVNQETVSKSLRLIGSDLHFHPSYQRVKNKSQSEMPLTFMIASLSSQDSEGNLQRDGHDGVSMSYSMFYDIDQTQIISLHLIPIMQKLIEAKMDYENLSDYFESSKLFSENMLKIFNVGLERFLSHDYVSSIQILTPLFEKTFMDITEAIGGADTVASRIQKGSQDQVWTQDKVLGEDFLKDDIDFR